MNALAVGSTLHGHRLLGRLGGGRSGEVWSAEFDGRPCALKLFTASRDRAALRRELDVQLRLSRLPRADARWFPRVEQIDLDAEPPFVRMELIEGRPLEALSAGEPLERRLGVAERVLRALDAVHRAGHVHGDLQPRNVLVTPGGDVRLIDVGYGGGSAPEDIAVSAAPGEVEGVASPLYAAPERFGADGPGPAADVFSFGKLFYRLVAGEAPHAVKPLSLSSRALAPWDAFLFRCVEARPEARFAAAGEALRDFLRILRPALGPGEVSAACPDCGAVTPLRDAGEGARFDCRGCGRRLEVLHVDRDARSASTATVSPGEPPRDVVFVEDPPPPGPRETSRPFPEVRRDPPSFAFEGLLTLLGYFLLWVPGAILNLHFLSQVRRARRATGRDPEGATVLRFLLWVFFIAPLAFAALATVTVVVLASLPLLGR
jgi:serine/threonine protein kinase